MANLIETAMHVLSYFCIFVIYGLYVMHSEKINQCVRPAWRYYLLFWPPRRSARVLGVLARGVLGLLTRTFDLRTGHAGPPAAGPEPEQERQQRGLRHAGLDRRHHHDLISCGLLQRLVRDSVWKSKFYGAFVLNHRVVLYAIDATPARWRGDSGSSPLDRARTAASYRSNFVVFIGGGEEALTGKTKLQAAILSATLFFFSTVYAFNAIRAQNRFGSEYKATKKHWKDSNPRANTVAAFLLIELVITTILAVLAAGVHVPIVGSSDSAAKKEDRKEDGAPPVAEEQA